jgi:hypothetical protein
MSNELESGSLRAMVVHEFRLGVIGSVPTRMVFKLVTTTSM